MAERPKAVVLKTTERKLRGFESLSLRQFDIPSRFHRPGNPVDFSMLPVNAAIHDPVHGFRIEFCEF